MSINNKATEVCAIRTLRAGKKTTETEAHAWQYQQISFSYYSHSALDSQNSAITTKKANRREETMQGTHTPNTFRCTTILFFVGSRLILIWIINRPNRRNVHDVLSSQPPNREHEYYWAVAKYRNIIPEKKYPSKRYCLRSCVAKCAVSVTVWRS